MHYYLKFILVVNNKYINFIIDTHGNGRGQNRESSLWIANEDFEIHVMLKI